MLQTWCFFNNVRDGSLMIGIYTLITRFTAFLIASFCSANARNVKNVLGYPFSHIEVTSIRITFVWIGLYSLLFVAASLSMLYGIFKVKRFLILPWITCMILDLLGNSVIVVLCGIGMVSKTSIGGVIGGLLIVIVIYAFNVYCTLCVISHNENLKHLELISQFSTHATRLPSISESLQGLIENEEQPSPELHRPALRITSPNDIKLRRSISHGPSATVEIYV